MGTASSRVMAVFGLICQLTLAADELAQMTHNEAAGVLEWCMDGIGWDGGVWMWHLNGPNLACDVAVYQVNGEELRELFTNPMEPDQDSNNTIRRVRVFLREDSLLGDVQIVRVTMDFPSKQLLQSHGNSLSPMYLTNMAMCPSTKWRLESNLVNCLQSQFRW